MRTETSRRIYVVRVEINEKTAYIQARSFTARTLGENLKELPSWRRGKSDHMKNPNSIMLESDEEFISLTLRTRNSKKPSRMPVRKWKRQWLPLCLARQARTVSMERHVVNSMRSNQNLRVFLEASESTRLRMGESLPNHHEDHIAGKVDNSLQHYNLVHKFIPMPQAMKIPAAKAAVDKEWGKLEKISAWNLPKSQK